MINEAPMTPGARRAKAAQTKQVYTTAKGGQTLQNLRLRQKGSQDAAARAKRTMSTAANPVAIDTGPVRTPVVPLSAPRILSRKPKPMKPAKPKKPMAPKTNTLDTPVTTEQIGTPGARNYAKIMRARRDAQRRAAAQNINQPVGGQSQSTTSTTSTTGTKKSVPVLNRKAFVSKSSDDLKKRIAQKKAAMTGPGTVATIKQNQQDRRTAAAKAAKDAADKAKQDQDDADKEAKRRAKDAADARSERRKRNLKRAVVGTGLAGAAASFALASHTEYDKPSIRERKKMKTLKDVREKYTQKQRIMRDMGRNRGKDPSGAMKAKIAKDADELSKSYPGGGAPIRDKDIQRRAVGGYGGHEIERGVKKKQNYDFVPVSRDKLDAPDRPSPAERLKRKKEKDARQMKMRKSGSGRDNVGGVGVREAKMVTGNETGIMFKVSVEGLPDMIMVGKSPGQIKNQLRKIVKQPSMIQGVERMPKSKVKMMYRDIVAGRDEEE